MRILLITDAWAPQMNGVVRTLTRTVEECRKMGHEVEVISPYDGYKTFPLPTYKEIRVAPFAKKDVERRVAEFEPDAIHIATEGPLGQAARSLCMKWEMPYTTSYHTQFPEYVNTRFPFIPVGLGYAFMRRFHNSGGRVMVTTQTMKDRLDERGLKNLAVWARGVDTDMFSPLKKSNPEDVFDGLERPIFINVGRVAVEKNIEGFLELDLPGTKVIVGDGPQLGELKKKYSSAVFTGAKFGEDLARHFADADVFVFPSKTDTFGLVILEAMACGTPVAAYPVPGPGDIIPGSDAGVLDDDLKAAALAALKVDPAAARAHAEKYSWRACAEVFVQHLKPDDQKPKRRRIWRRLRSMARRKKVWFEPAGSKDSEAQN